MPGTVLDSGCTTTNKANEILNHGRDEVNKKINKMNSCDIEQNDT